MTAMYRQGSPQTPSSNHNRQLRIPRRPPPASRCTNAAPRTLPASRHAASRHGPSSPALTFPHHFHPTVRPTFRLLCRLSVVLAACACASAAPPPDPNVVTAPVRPLAPLAAQQVIVAPLNALREADALGWTQQIPRSREFMRAFDDALEAELAARGLKSSWVFPAALVRAARANPAYSVDPYTLAASPLRSDKLVARSRFGDPLASQLRTMIALQESARAILIPVELRFDRLPDGRGAAVARLALLDGRLSEVIWLGEVVSTPASAFSRDLLTSLAAHTADLIAAP
jgi:hypothetical protein